MRILLVRHGKAVDTHEAPSDGARWLSRQGRIAMRSVGRALHELGLRYTRIYTSPLVRAVQTAEILAAVEPFEGPLQVSVALAPDSGTTAEALGPLEELEAGDVAVFVGHEPRIRLMAGQLLGVERFPAFRTGAACLLHCLDEEVHFEWMLDPATGGPVRDLHALG
jgi:phosphohistidine phosphatase